MPGRRGKPSADDDVADDAEALTVLDLDDPEVGIRPEDRFAAIPPGPRLVPRRVHDESTRAPVLLLAGLLAVFVLGSWLAGLSSDERPSRPGRAAPALAVDTETELLLVGGDSVAELDVGRGDARPGDDAATPALLRNRPARSRVLPSATAGRAWIVAGAPDGISTAREVDLGTGRTTAEANVDGVILAATAVGLVVEHELATQILVSFDGIPIGIVARNSRLLGAAGAVAATRPTRCEAEPCPIVIHDLDTGTTHELPVELAARGREVGSLSPDGRVLAYARTDGVETRGVIIDIKVGTTTPFRARGVARGALGPATLAWSPAGDWLFLATGRNGLDAVATADGTAYRVDADLPPFDVILIR